MKIQNRAVKFPHALFLLMLWALAAQVSGQTQEDTNTAVIQQAFEDWRQGRGGVFELLAEDAEWTVAGVSPVSATYDSKQALFEEAVEPIHAQLSTPITPRVRHILAQGNSVVVLWDGSAIAVDGSPYNNSYAWHLVLENGTITHVTAFLDTWALIDLME